MQSELLRQDRQRPDLERQDRLLQSSPVLQTARLTLRAPATTDIDALAHLANNLNVAAMLSRMPHPYTVRDAADFIARVKNGGIGKRVYAVTLKTTGQFLGCCGIEPQEDPRTLELGYWLGEPHWNKGYATEAVHALIDLAFSDPMIERIDARCRVVNIGSHRVLHKSGFQFQGSGMCPSLSMGGSLAVEWYRLDRKTWGALKMWGGEQ